MSERVRAFVDGLRSLSCAAATQPPSIFARNSGEHWAGRLYVRRFSPYADARCCCRRGVTPERGDVGDARRRARRGRGAHAARAARRRVAAALLIQLQILLDCSDGELARWRQQFSPARRSTSTGIGHYVTETALPIALGIRADGGWDEIGDVHDARARRRGARADGADGERARRTSRAPRPGKPVVEDTAAVAAPRASGCCGGCAGALGFFPFFRAFVAIEATLLALAGRAARRRARRPRGDARARRSRSCPVAAITAVGHLVAILALGAAAMTPASAASC